MAAELQHHGFGLLDQQVFQQASSSGPKASTSRSSSSSASVVDAARFSYQDLPTIHPYHHQSHSAASAISTGGSQGTRKGKQVRGGLLPSSVSTVSGSVGGQVFASAFNFGNASVVPNHTVSASPNSTVLIARPSSRPPGNEPLPSPAELFAAIFEPNLDDDQSWFA